MDAEPREINNKHNILINSRSKTMKRYLLFMLMCVLAVLGAKADPVNWSYTVDGVTYTGEYDILGDHVRIKANQPGGLAVFINQTKDATPALGGIGADGTAALLRIETGADGLNEDDFNALNSSDVPALGHFTSIDLSEATVASVSTMSGMSMGNVKYLRLPSNFQSTTEMADLRSQMPALEMALSFSDLETTTPKVFIHSFKSNSRVAAFAALNCEATLNNAVYATLSGDYGDDDLIAHNGNLPFMKAAVWDFTGASFDNCRVNASVVNRGPYYASDDPFQEHGTVTLSSSYPSNAFYYFSNYATKVVSIKLPTGITELPPACLNRLGEENGPNYKLVYNKTSEELAAIEAELSEIMTAQNKSYTSGTYYPIDELVVPDNIVTVGYECCVQSVIRSVQLGTGVKEVQGGAFKLNYFLNNLDCKTGISDCRLGDQAFNECNNMKHIVLSEGIISLGANCFNNSQNLESIRLPETLTSIGNYCFQDGHALSSITIPAGVHKIGMGAFALTALTDVYLMAEDIADVPIIYTAGSDWGDGKSTFNRNTMESNNTLNWDGNGNFNGKSSKKVNEMTFDEAAEAYFAYCNRMAALHFSPKIADVVLAEISSHYGCTSTDGYGIPVMQTGDSDKRANAMGLQDMGSAGQGIYTQYGWAQFLIQKEFTPAHPEVYTKEYDDVWYTMCFPFDLTDEQLAAAFNEGFNIADFSGVEIKDETEDNPKTMILHFNTVAKTTYKDAEENVYTVTGREKDGKFDYNIYQRDGITYRHVKVGTGGENYKTKTFAKDGNQQNGVIEIDGILATAGHPYMIHPNTGTNSGMPLTRCHFSGITWKPAEQWETIFNAEKRVVDLGVAKGTIGETLKDCTPSPDNYLQAAYSEHIGETYTFIGNWKQYRTDIEIPASLEKPTVENGKLTATPLVTEYTDLYPQGPAMPEARKTLLQTVGPKRTTAPTSVDNPDSDTDTYPTDIQNLFKTVRCSYTQWENGNVDYSFTYGDDLAAFEWNEFIKYENNTYSYKDQSEGHGWKSLNAEGLAAFKAYLGDPLTSLDAFNTLKAKAISYVPLKAAYDEYLADKDAYEANVAAWTEYETNYASEEAAYQSALTTYTQKISQWYAAVASVTASNRQILAQWEEDMKPYQVLIPKYSYFLGRRGRGWPKFYREMADDTRTNPTGGFWTMYTAIVTPNQKALDGLEAELDGNTQQAKGSDMLFDEGFFNLLEEMNQGGIATAIEEAKKESNTSIEYMDIVVSVDGQVIRRGSTSLEGLPKGLYIINGKKYFVK